MFHVFILPVPHSSVDTFAVSSAANPAVAPTTVDQTAPPIPNLTSVGKRYFI